MKLGIATRLTLWMAVLGCGAAGLTGYYAWDASCRLERQSAHSELLTSTQVLARRISLNLESIERKIEIARTAETIGYPLLVKASAGGGGRGMRRVDEHGLVHLTGRHKDIIITGGLNVSPREIEEVTDFLFDRVIGKGRKERLCPIGRVALAVLPTAEYALVERVDAHLGKERVVVARAARTAGPHGLEHAQSLERRREARVEHHHECALLGLASRGPRLPGPSLGPDLADAQGQAQTWPGPRPGLGLGPA